MLGENNVKSHERNLNYDISKVPIKLLRKDQLRRYYGMSVSIFNRLIMTEDCRDFIGIEPKSFAKQQWLNWSQSRNFILYYELSAEQVKEISKIDWTVPIKRGNHV